MMWTTTLGLTLALCGCGNPEATTVSGPDGGKVTVTSDGKTTVTDGKGNTVEAQSGADGKEMKVTTSSGDTASLGGVTVTEAELRLPYYPDSKALQNRDIKLDRNGIKTFMSVRTTTDSPSKVIAFYKGKVKEPQTVESGKTSSLSGRLDGPWKVNVLAMARDGVTQVQIGLSDDPKG